MSNAILQGPVARTADGVINEYRLVKITSTGCAQSSAAAADTDQHGVVQRIKAAVGSATFGDPAAAGDQVDVHLVGIVQCTAGAAVTIGDLVMSDASGRVIAATATNFAIATALEAAGAAGDIIRILLHGPVKL